MTRKSIFAPLQKGFTLIELLVVMGIIAILVAVVAVAVNPGRQFAQARNTQRRSDLSAILNAVYQYATDNNGNFPSTLTGVTTATNIGTSFVDLTVLTPTYINTIPFDPVTGNAADTNYTIMLDTNSRVTVAAPDAELSPTPPIAISR